MSELSLTDLFCGAGGSSTGAIQIPGVEVRIASNHWQLAVDTHNENHPQADHRCANISRTDPRTFPRTDILWASPECFTAGHLVTTARGQIPIEDVVIGDLALTHKGRWRPVVRIQSRNASTVIVKGQGHAGIEVTPNHRFWMKTSNLEWQNEIRQYKRQYADADWLRVDKAVERDALWSTPVRTAPLDIDTPPAVFGLDLSAAWWLVGRWVGDGSLSFGRNHEVLLTCGFHEADELRSRLADTRSIWGESRKRTGVVFYIGDEKARDWLADNFGHGAERKQIASWAFAMPHTHRRALLDGYMSADGGMTQRRARCSTVSRRLAVSVRILAEGLGHRVAMAHDKRTTYSIEGRTGRARLQWILHWEPQLSSRRAPEAFSDDLHAWSRVRSATPGREDVTVYNIEVDEDHSYVLDGIVVANCTNHSRAKGRKKFQQADLFDDAPLPDEAADRSRATMWDVPRFAEAHGYRAIIVENVADAVDWAPEWSPERGTLFRSWLAAMDGMGYDHRVVYLNSMHAQLFGPGAPQSRDRLYVVFWRRGNRAPDIERVLRPQAICPECGPVMAMQVFKPGASKVARYRAQYQYRCPNTKCRNLVLEPAVRPAAEIIDWSDLGTRIGDRAKPLAAKTMARIQAGIEKYWSLDALAVPVEGREGKQARPVGDPLRTMSTRNETGWAFLTQFRDRVRDLDPMVEPLSTVVADGANHGLCSAPAAFMAELRGGGSKHRPVTDPLATVTASGNHHGLVTAYYGRGGTTPASVPLPTCTTVETDGVAMGPTIDINDVRFRMLEPREIIAAMDFPAEYVVLGTRREQVRMAGNAVTPPAARDLVGVVAESLGVVA